MEKETYKYDAFISYRHCDLDKFVAENLHKILESYDLPKNIKEKLNIKGKTFKRVFRDQEELPLAANLENPIVEALENTKYLIVICSPRLKDSTWCRKEIETFIKLRGRKNIFCVLVEGEPDDSFPDILRHDSKGKPLEPLAADVRGESKREVLKKLKSEKLRLIAPMHGLDYDDLKQRHKIKKQRQIMVTSIVIASFLLLFALYTSIMLIKINNQQKVLKYHQAISLANDSLNYLSKDSKYNAVKSSYEALTTFNGVKMPYTPEAEYALSESLGVYDAGLSFKAVDEINTKGVVDNVELSEDKKHIVIYDESEEISIYNTDDLSKVATITDIKGSSVNEFYYTFASNDILAYINKEGNISLVKVSDGKLIKEIEKKDASYISVQGNFGGKYITYLDKHNLYIYDMDNDKIIGSIYNKDDYLKGVMFSSDNKYIFAGTQENNFDFEGNDNIVIHVIEVDKAKEINSKELDANYLINMLDKNNNVYLLLNKSNGVDYNTVLVSYNYLKGTINWTKIFPGDWGKHLTQSFAEGTNDIAVVNYDTINVLRMNNGEEVSAFNAKSEIIEIYAYLNSNNYLAFTKTGNVNIINMTANKNIEYIGKYELNAGEYSKVININSDFILVPQNENRIIYYKANKNKDLKEEDIEIKTVSNDSIPSTKYDELKEEYDIKNKNLVNTMIYSDKKDLLIVNYVDKTVAIYDTDSKKLLNTVDKLGRINHFFGKDKDGRIYIGDISDSYILDKDYNKVGHIKSLAKLEDDRVIISSEGNTYSLPIYNLKDILKMAEEYLDE